MTPLTCKCSQAGVHGPEQNNAGSVHRDLASASNSTSGADLGKFERGLSSCHVILSANVGARALKGLEIARDIEVRGELESETQSMIVSLMIWPGKNQSGIWLLFQATSFGKLDLLEKV